MLGPRPAEVEALIERRRKLGLDLYDENWEGCYHVVPAPHPAHGFVGHELAVLLASAAETQGLVGLGPFNLGEPDDYRVPDGGYHRGLPDTAFVPTAAIVVAVVSPDDETFAKFDFYAAHGVEELLIADPTLRSVRFFVLDEGRRYIEAESSALLVVRAAEVTSAIAWP